MNVGARAVPLGGITHGAGDGSETTWFADCVALSTCHARTVPSADAEQRMRGVAWKSTSAVTAPVWPASSADVPSLQQQARRHHHHQPRNQLLAGFVPPAPPGPAPPGYVEHPGYSALRSNGCVAAKGRIDGRELQRVAGTHTVWWPVMPPVCVPQNSQPSA